MAEACGNRTHLRPPQPAPDNGLETGRYLLSPEASKQILADLIPTTPVFSDDPW